MILRPRQKVALERTICSLSRHGNTLLKAPTGFGKTIVLSAVASDYAPKGTVLTIQGRGELLKQNRAAFKKMNPRFTTDVVDADRKGWNGDAIFAMVQTLCNKTNINTIPDGISLLCIDEAHHSAADSYLRIIDKVKETSPEAHIFGVTATPERGDRKALTSIFSNVSDSITMAELIASGNLVPPVAFGIEIDGITDALGDLRPSGGEYDDDLVASILDKPVVSNAIITHWREKAGNRQTVVFATNIEHTVHLAEAFREQGVSCEFVHGQQSDKINDSILAAYDKGRIQVLVNCLKLTEGWDCQPVSCVVMAKMCALKGTMIQIIGRGLRAVDPERYPGVIKNDCVVLDFGRSLYTHKNIDAGDRLDPSVLGDGMAPEKDCPQCQALIHASFRTCPMCGYEFPPPEKDEENEELHEFTMTELSIIESSPFKWEELFDGLVIIANGLTAWACVVNMNGVFCAIGGGSTPAVGIRLLSKTQIKQMAIAVADDFLRQEGDATGSKKTKSWLKNQASDKQIEILGPPHTVFSVSRYRASCLITWKFNENKIRTKILSSLR